MSGELDTENGTFDTIDIKNDGNSSSCRDEDLEDVLEQQQQSQQQHHQPQNISDKANNGNGFLEENDDDGDEIFRSSISNSTMSEATVSFIFWGYFLKN